MLDDLKSKKGSKFLLGVWAFLVLADGYYFVKDIYHITEKIKCTETVQAVAEEPKAVTTTNNSRGKTRTHTYYHPTVRYTFEGKYYSSTYEFSSTSNSYPKGTSVQIKVNPNDPTTFYIVDDYSPASDIFEHGLFFMLIGVLPVALYHFRSYITPYLHKEINIGKPTLIETENMVRVQMQREEEQERQLKLRLQTEQYWVERRLRERAQQSAVPPEAPSEAQPEELRQMNGGEQGHPQ